jgi:hypothetical protein
MDGHIAPILFPLPFSVLVTIHNLRCSFDGEEQLLSKQQTLLSALD